jgi:IS30 family transposase
MLELAESGLSERKIALALGRAKGTVSTILRRGREETLRLSR